MDCLSVRPVQDGGFFYNALKLKDLCLSDQTGRPLKMAKKSISAGNLREKAEERLRELTDDERRRQDEGVDDYLRFGQTYKAMFSG